MAKVKQQLWHEPEYDLELIQVNDMHISKMSNSKFIKKDDVETPVLVTISKIEQQNVAMDNEPPDMKWTMYFSDYEKPLVLNQTNITLASLALNSEDTDGWIGKNIVLFNDPTIMYAGKVTGGVRIRAPKPSAPVAANTATASQSDPAFNDDIPF